MTKTCPRCGASNATNAAICGACTARLTSASTALVPLKPRSALPVLSQSQKATLGSVALGMAALALRAGAALLQRQDDANATSGTTLPRRIAKSTAQNPSDGQWTIRRRWVVGNAEGPQQWGEEEIEIEPPNEGAASRLRLNFRPPPSS